MRAYAYTREQAGTGRMKKQPQNPELNTESGKRNAILARTKRNFLRFRYRKPTAPKRKTYGSNGGNI